MQRMEAELLFDHPAGRDLAVAELIKQGFSVEQLPTVDEFEGVVLTETVWLKVSGLFDGDDSAFFAEMMHLAEQYDGDVCEAGFADPQQ